MELRTLKYFLTVADEENITKAANLLYITQPTLSRQLMQLEEELGTKLFKRSKYKVILTEEGKLLKSKAKEIIAISEKIKQDFSKEDKMISGKINIGCGETKSMTFLSKKISSFRKKYPMVQFNIYSANADDVKDRIEKGILDIGLLTKPVDIEKYEFIRMPEKEVWGILVNKNSNLAGKNFVSPKDLLNYPLIIAERDKVQSELKNWFGEFYEKIEVAATYNLILNGINMVKNGVGVALCINFDNIYNNLSFIPLSPKLETGSVVVWKKNQLFSKTSLEFINYLKNRD